MNDVNAGENNISMISIILEDRTIAGRVNDLLSMYGQYIVGRLGIPYKNKNISVICIVLDAPADTVSTISGKLGMFDGVSAKTVMSKKKY